MTAPRFDAVVVGGGIAGLAAAAELSRLGIPAVLIDENPQPGGWAVQPGAVRTGMVSRWHARRTEHARRDLAHSKVRVLRSTIAWHVDDDRVYLAGPGREGTDELAFGRLVLATGGYPAPVPFPGWTLAGVSGAGGGPRPERDAADVPPGARVIVAGGGPGLLPAAARAHRAGLRVTAVIDATPALVVPGLPAAGSPALARAASRIARARGYLLSSRVRVADSSVVTAVAGDGRVEAVHLARLSCDGFPETGQETWPADWLHLSYGQLPENILARIAGCEHRFAGPLAGWLAQHDPWMRTSAERVYVAGACAGATTPERAGLEGIVAARSVAADLTGGTGDRPPAARAAGGRPGAVPGPEADRRYRARLDGTARYEAELSECHPVPAGVLQLTRPGTFICRCEEVTVDCLAALRDEGWRDVNAVKAATRTGMGQCQGRGCAALVTRLFATEGSTPQTFTARPPARPLTIGELAQEVDDFAFTQPFD